MEKCDCYHTREAIVGWLGPDEFKYDIVYECWGTPEREETNCDGDRTKCRFYSEVRDKANAKMQSELNGMELEFYRYYLMKHDLVWDAMSEYKKWRKERE